MEPDSIAPWTAAEQKLRLTFSFGYSPEDFQFIVRLIGAGRMTTDHLITRSLTLDEVPEAFASLMEPNSHCKLMIEPH